MLPVLLLGGLLLGLKRWPLLIVLVLAWTVLVVTDSDEPVTVAFVRDVALLAAGNAVAGGLFREGFVLLRSVVRGVEDALRHHSR